MYKQAVFSLVLTLLVAGGVFAQSADKGSGSKGSDSKSGAAYTSKAEAAAMKRMKKEVAIQKRRLVSGFVKTELSGIKLSKDQKKVLEGMFEEKFEEITSLNESMGNAIPEEKREMVHRAFKKAQRKGAMETAAMQSSMTDAELPEMVQQKVMDYSMKKKTLMKSMLEQFSASLDESQKQMLAEKMKEKAMPAGSTKKEETKMKDGDKSAAGASESNKVSS